MVACLPDRTARGAGSSAADRILQTSSFRKVAAGSGGECCFPKGGEKCFPFAAAGLQPVAVRRMGIQKLRSL